MHETWPNERTQNDLDRLPAPIHLDTEPDNSRHDAIENRPEASSHTPGATTKDSETEMLMRAWPACYDSNESYYNRDSNDKAHGLRNAEAKGEKGGAKGPCCRVDAGNHPIAGIALPRPRLPVWWDRNEISIAPLLGY